MCCVCCAPVSREGKDTFTTVAGRHLSGRLTPVRASRPYLKHTESQIKVQLQEEKKKDAPLVQEEAKLPSGGGSKVIPESVGRVEQKKAGGKGASSLGQVVGAAERAMAESRFVEQGGVPSGDWKEPSGPMRIEAQKKIAELQATVEAGQKELKFFKSRMEQQESRHITALQAKDAELDRCKLQFQELQQRLTEIRAAASQSDSDAHVKYIAMSKDLTLMQVGTTVCSTVCVCVSSSCRACALCKYMLIVYSVYLVFDVLPGLFTFVSAHIQQGYRYILIPVLAPPTGTIPAEGGR